MSADGRPYIGATRVAGLYVNTGHGHLGWTQAAGSGSLLAQLMAGDPAAIDPRPFAPARGERRAWRSEAQPVEQHS
jgi:D-amino-acid dehydrogenase